MVPGEGGGGIWGALVGSIVTLVAPIRKDHSSHRQVLSCRFGQTAMAYCPLHLGIRLNEFA